MRVSRLLLVVVIALAGHVVGANELTFELNRLRAYLDRELTENPRNPRLPTASWIHAITEDAAEIVYAQPLEESATQLMVANAIFIGYGQYFAEYPEEFALVTAGTTRLAAIMVERFETEGYPPYSDRHQVLQGFGQTLEGMFMIMLSHREIAAEHRLIIARTAIPAAEQHWQLIPFTYRAQLVTLLTSVGSAEPSEELRGMIRRFLRDKSFNDEMMKREP